MSDLEKISHSSYRNLQRIFKSVFKESIGAFQKRLKLEKGYKQLIYSNFPIGSIAIDAGFESVQSFSKAFKKRYSISPARARKEKFNLLPVFFRSHDNEKKSITYEKLYLPVKKVFFKSIQTYNYTNADINHLWDEIDAEVNSKKSVSYYGVILDEPLITDKAKCRYEACFDGDNAPADYYVTTIFGQWYAKFVHKGSYDTIEETYQAIYYDWLFNSPLEFDNSAIIEHYAVHGSNETDETKFSTEILIPLRKK